MTPEQQLSGFIAEVRAANQNSRQGLHGSDMRGPW
jgi:hypothetical protein